jgi:tRNA-dihydrouridine synthase
VAKGAGAALMKHPARIEAIVRAVRAAVSLPVSVKTRIGYAAGAPSAEEVARAAEAGGAQAIAVHARLASAKHGGPANWDALARVKGAVAIPVIGNGGVDNAADALRMLRETGVDGVMIGRGAIGRPWIFAEIATLAAGRSVAEVTPPIRRAIIAEHLERLVALKAVEHRRRRRKPPSAETAAVLHFRGHLHRYLAGLPGWPAERRRFNEIKTAAEVLAMVDRLLGLAPADRGSACGLARKVRGATE